MNYLELFKIRAIEQQDIIIQKIRSIEKDLLLKLPPILCVFFQTFEFENSIKGELVYYKESISSLSSFMEGYFLFEEDIAFYRFFQIEEIVKNMRIVYNKEDEIWDKQVIAIAECAFQGFLLIGVGNANKDKVYIEYATETPRITYLCENILDFFRNYIVKPDAISMQRNKFQLSQLYRNWGEDFWRVREDG